MNMDFTQLTALRYEWQALQPLTAENEARLWKKLRLEWNYHSNHIEGNTLTYGETELLILHDRTTGNHSHREYLEMKAHDAGIEHVRTLAADKARLLTESDIRDLNKIILKEPFWKAAETADSQPTRKEIIPGQYKTTPNNVRLPNGDIFFFASVEDTSPKMQVLTDWLRQELESPTLHPVGFAAKLHHDFVLIHPFDDGNGRVARLLVNYVLMRSGYLPLIVRTEDKANYLTALHLADAGELSALIGYFHQLTEWSLHLGIKAAKGEAIQEPSDVEKEVAIFINQQKATANNITPRTPSGVRELIRLSIKPFIHLLDTKMKTLCALFGEYSFENPDAESDSTSFRSVTEMVEREIMNFRPKSAAPPPDFIRRIYRFYGYKGASSQPFDVRYEIVVRFNPAEYQFEADERKIAAYPYSQPLVGSAAETLAAGMLDTVFQHIKKLSGIKK